MELEFRATADDYIAFYQYYYFRRKLTVRVVYWSLFCFVIGNLLNAQRSILSWPYALTVLAVALGIILFVFVIPYGRAIYRFKKVLAGPGKIDQPRRIEVTTDGFTLQWIGEGMEGEPVLHYWAESIKGVDYTDRLVIILLVGVFPVLIPRSCFSTESNFVNFVAALQNEMMSARVMAQKFDHGKERRLRYWGLLGLIPNVGAIAGVVLIIQGIFRYKSWKLIVIGAGDIAFTFIFWIVFFPLIDNSAASIQAKREMSQGQLNTVFKALEFYQLEHGHYPDSLPEIEDVKGNVWIIDLMPNYGFRSKRRRFYYEKTGDKYWLFSVGVDGKAFTEDDIFPMMNPADSTKFGLRMR